MVDSQTLKNFWTELENGSFVEHYRPRRRKKPWQEKLVVPQSVTRVYRGLWGDLRTVQPLLDIEDLETLRLGTIETKYTPMRYRIDVMPKVRKRHQADIWNIYPDSAAYAATPQLKGRRPIESIWCLLLMYVFDTEKYRSSFWVNPLEPAWDSSTRDESSYGQTFYVDHRPIPVTTAFIRLDKLQGTMKHRGCTARDTLASLLTSSIPHEEWRPPEREGKPVDTKKYKLPKHYLQESQV